MSNSNDRHSKVGTSLQGLEVRSFTLDLNQIKCMLQKQFTKLAGQNLDGVNQK